jgi:hypothetical protein
VLLRDYVEAFCAEAPAAEDIRAFIRRNPA